MHVPLPPPQPGRKVAFHQAAREPPACLVPGTAQPGPGKEGVASFPCPPPSPPHLAGKVLGAPEPPRAEPAALGVRRGRAPQELGGSEGLSPGQGWRVRPRASTWFLFCCKELDTTLTSYPFTNNSSGPLICDPRRK